jgi:DNA-binding beta-propeller fold protein YncE
MSGDLQNRDPLTSRRLDGWKEIADHLGKHLSVRTAQRWESEGMPVQRDGVKVFAYAEELDVWKESRIFRPSNGAAKHLPVAKPKLTNHKLIAALTGLTFAFAVLFAGYRLIRTPKEYPVPQRDFSRPRRLLAKATAEGQFPYHLNVPFRCVKLLISSDGGSLFALSRPQDRAITVIGVRNLQIERTVQLPVQPRTAVLSTNNKHLYISSFEGDIAVVDTTTGRTSLIHNDVPAFDIAVTRDESKLFLALGYSGLRRIDLKTYETRIVSPVSCPVYVALNNTGKRLYVSYQCSGIGGLAGHNTIDILDVDSENSVGVVNNLAMVAGRAIFAPDQKEDIVMIDGTDACSRPVYDHVGCLEVPSHPFYLWRTSDRRLIGTLLEPGGPAEFVTPGTRMIVAGNLTIWDWSRQVVVERFESPGTRFEAVAVAPQAERTFGAERDRNQIQVFDPEPKEWLPPADGLVNFYSGDGTPDDSQGTAAVAFGGTPRYAPGLMGQAFSLDGSAVLRLRHGAALCAYCLDSISFSFFVKFHPDDAEMSILQQEGDLPMWRLRLFKAKDNRIVLENGSHENSIVSKDRIRPEVWHHFAVVATAGSRLLYLDGLLQGKQPLGAAKYIPDENIERLMLYLGSTHGKRDFLNGLMDEIAVYSRPLTAGEITKLSKPSG